MSKRISHTQLTETIGLTECTDGWWLYDTTRGFNLSMRAKSKDEAFVDALEYYQDRLKEVESKYYTLAETVDSFVKNFVNDEDIVEVL